MPTIEIPKNHLHVKKPLDVNRSDSAEPVSSLLICPNFIQMKPAYVINVPKPSIARAMIGLMEISIGILISIINNLY